MAFLQEFPLATSQTFELSIWPGRERIALIELLEEHGIHDFVEAATDAVNADDVDWDKVFAAWTSRDDSPLLIYRDDEADLKGLREAVVSRFGDAVKFSGKWIANSLWQEAWEPDFRYLETERFYIGPADARDAAKDKTAILLADSTVFGSGQHATTQALVRLMEAQKKPGSGARFLDVGTGTGVLAFVAHHLGYDTLFGTDIEEDAIAIARENARENNISVTLFHGSLPFNQRLWDTIACNILPPTLTELLATLSELLKPEGQLYLAGFHEANSEPIAAELARLGWAVVDERRERGWLGWLARRL